MMTPCFTHFHVAHGEHCKSCGRRIVRDSMGREVKEKLKSYTVKFLSADGDRVRVDTVTIPSAEPNAECLRKRLRELDGFICNGQLIDGFKGPDVSVPYHAIISIQEEQ